MTATTSEIGRRSAKETMFIGRPTEYSAAARVVCCASCCSFSFGHDPSRLQERIGNQSDDRSHGDESRIADLPAKQDRKRDHADEGGQPIADGDTAEQEA